MKRKTVVVKKKVDLKVVYLLRAFDEDSRFLESKYVNEKPSDEDIAEFIENQNAYYCTVEEMCTTRNDFPTDQFDCEDDEDDDWEI